MENNEKQISKRSIDETSDSKQNTFAEISRNFRGFLRVRKFYSMIRSANVVMIGFAAGLTLWFVAVLFLWLLSSDYYSFATAQTSSLIYVIPAFVLFLLFAIVLDSKKFSRNCVNLSQYIHWCDVEQNFESELLTAFERDDVVTKTSFDEFITKKAIDRIKNAGVPKPYTKVDLKRIYVFAGMLLFIACLIVLLDTIGSKIDSDTSKFAFNDDADQPEMLDSDSGSGKEDVVNETTKNKDNAGSDSQFQDNRKEKLEVTEEKENDNDKDKKGEGDDKSKKDDQNEKSEDKSEKKPENKQNSGEKPENSKDSRNGDDNAKFELDPKKISPDASETGETKKKKDKVYHLDNNSNAEGSLIDPKKLLPNIKTAKGSTKSLPLSAREKELIEKYRNMLEKKLSSR